jgi:hypothetical protein
MPTTPNRGWIYPAESANPYFETIEDFFLAQDTDVQGAITAAAAKLPLAGGSLTGPLGLWSAGADPTIAGNLQRNGNALRYHYGQAVGSVVQTVWTHPGYVGTPATTAESTLSSYTIPADTLTVNGRHLRLHAGMLTGSGAMSRVIRIRFGSAVILTASVPEASTILLDAFINRQATNGQFATTIATANTVQITNFASLTETETAAIVIQVTAEQSVATAGAVAQVTGYLTMHG